VICFTLNYQSVDGASSVARSILEQRRKLDRPVRLLPVPMRVLDSEKFKLEAVTAYGQSRFLPLIDEADVPAGPAREKYWQEVLVPHVGFYGFEEHLAWFLEPATQVAGVLGSMKRLARYVTGIDFTDLAGPDPEERSEELARFGAVWSMPIDTSVRAAPGTVVPASPLTRVYVSFSELDRDAAQRVAKAVEQNVGDTFLSSHLSRDRSFSDGIRASLERAKGMVFVIGPGGISLLQGRSGARVALRRSLGSGGIGPNLGHPRGADSATLRTGGSNSMR
jgi:hypothetical protein